MVLELTTLDPRSGEPAIAHIRAALEAGRHVVTAKKGPIAYAYRDLLGLAAERFGPPASAQDPLFEEARVAHRNARGARLREAVAQVRTVAGQDAALRAVCVDPDSRVPERRAVLAPIPELRSWDGSCP